ncbi:MAG: RHS repeat-associated core domain-containing protein, partial [Pseudomarimonas sp.]
RGGTPITNKSYTYNARHQLTRVTDSVANLTTDYTWDGNGFMTSETETRAGQPSQTTTYRPNLQDRLATLTTPTGPPVHYSYDIDGLRVEKRSTLEATRYGYDGTTLRRETNVTNNPLVTYDWASGRILRTRRATQTSYAQHDALKSPVRWSLASGAEQGRATYTAWGENATSAGTLPPIGYGGYYADAESESYYAQQRYYSPRVGRFNRIDPWEGDPLNPITLNKYLYAAGNPLRFTDPDGRCPVALSPSECHTLSAEQLGVDPYSREGAEAVAEFETGRTIGQVRGAWTAVKETAQFIVDVPGSAIDLIPGVDVGSLNRMGERASGVWEFAKSPVQTVTTAVEAQATAHSDAREAHDFRGAGEVIGGVEGSVGAGAAMSYSGAGLSSLARGSRLGRIADDQGKALTVAEDPSGPTGPIGPISGAAPITWVDEGGNLRAGATAGMRPDAYRYQSSAPGARSSVESGRSQAPYLEFKDASGQTVGAKFDGVSETELIDRKLNPVFSAKAIDQARRQVAVAQHHGLQAVWELPSQRAVDAANRFMTTNEIDGITVRLKEP